MVHPGLTKSACGLVTLAAVLTFASSASADLGHRFLATAHGGAATEAAGGITTELRIFDDICLGGSLDLGVNFSGTYGSYSYIGPAVHGSYRLKIAENVELRPFFGARFPLGIGTSDTADYTIVDNSSIAFTTALRASVIIDMFVIGVQGDLTPHDVTWKQASTGKTEDVEELLIRASLVFGVAFGKGD